MKYIPDIEKKLNKSKTETMQNILLDKKHFLQLVVISSHNVDGKHTQLGCTFHTIFTGKQIEKILEVVDEALRALDPTIVGLNKQK